MNSSQRGFSLVEVLVAMLILTIGVLGLTASSAAITRMAGEGGRSSESASLAASRLDSLRLVPCASLASGSQSSGPYRLAWTVNTTSNNLRDVLLTVRYAIPGGNRTARYETRISCVPQVQ